MKRVIALAVALSFFGVTAAFAGPTATDRVPLKIGPAALAAMNAKVDARKTSAAGKSIAAAANQPQSFWHTPWPYVIAGAVAAVVIIHANKTYSSSGSTGY